MAYFGNLNQTAIGDFDGDGLTNLQEYLYGTDPTATTAHPAPAPFNNAPVGIPGTVELEMFDLGWWGDSFDAPNRLATRGSKFRETGALIQKNTSDSNALA